MYVLVFYYCIRPQGVVHCVTYMYRVWCTPLAAGRWIKRKHADQSGILVSRLDGTVQLAGSVPSWLMWSALHDEYVYIMEQNLSIS